MKKLAQAFFTTPVMAIILAVFALSIATATFIENSFDTATAKVMVYHSLWFELLLFLGILNLIGIIVKHKMYQKGKVFTMVMHLAFVFILIGAAITHFFAQQGYMHIRQNETSNRMISDDTYLEAKAQFQGKVDENSQAMLLTQSGQNYHRMSLNPGGKRVEIEMLHVVNGVADTLVPDKKGWPVLRLVIATSEGSKQLILQDKHSTLLDDIPIGLNVPSSMIGVQLSSIDNGLVIRTSQLVFVTEMSTMHQDTLWPGKVYPFKLSCLYRIGNVQLVGQYYLPAGRVDIKHVEIQDEKNRTDAISFRITTESAKKDVVYLFAHNALNNPIQVQLGEVNINLSFGPKQIELPFSLHLNQFILKHYPGSNSPSWFESRIQLEDKRFQVDEQRRIFMNNVLQYGGYRFYQSSFDSDEQGTILSVNKDIPGTWVTYFGYLLLAIGILAGFFSKHGRFHKLSIELARLRTIRYPLLIGLLFYLVSFKVHGAEYISDSLLVPKEEATKFGSILIQDPGGRLKPINTLSSEFLRKVARTNEWNGLNSDQVLLGMMLNPGYWQKERMIRVSLPEIKQILHLNGNFACFLDFLDSTQEHGYRLESYVKEAFQKRPSERTKFETEIIRLDERVDLCYMIFTGELLRVFPKPGDPQKRWFSPVNSGSEFPHKDSLFVNTVIPYYLGALREGKRSGNWENSDLASGAIRQYQQKYGGDITPGFSRIKMELLYNKLQIFDRIGAFYGLIGFVLLLLHFLFLFRPELHLKPLLKVGFCLLLLVFILHVSGLVLRWYVSGHAPWSNGYESMLYIAFASMAAGLLFSRISGMISATAALLSWLILFVAQLNWMDPEITNLVPVLQSYWLLIHVATITASYGFFGLGALLAFLNILLMVFQSQKDKTLSFILAELTMIIEMILMAGLYLISIGTFLGGVWANESWGRYWGWDAKETWALVSLLVYAFILHMRLVPGLKSVFLFNVMAFMGFLSIIMTYLGVNYFLTGLHSYGKGEAFPVPAFAFYSLISILFLIFIAWFRQKKLKAQKCGFLYFQDQLVK